MQFAAHDGFRESPGAAPHIQSSSSATGSRECAPDDRLQRTIQ